jgi:16S rRNA (uracil1498-N3)-methyltransferase
LDRILKLDNFLKLNQNTNIIFGDLNTDNNKINFKSSDPLCILIGPEGDFTVKERENILKLKKLIPLKINKNILRSETAAISALSIINYCLNL